MSYQATVSGFFAVSPPLNWLEIKESGFLEESQGSRFPRTSIVLNVESAETETDQGVSQIFTSNVAVPCGRAFDCRNLDEEAENFVTAMNAIGRTVKGVMLVQPHDYGDGEVWRVVVDENGVKKEMAELKWPDGTSVDPV